MKDGGRTNPGNARQAGRLNLRMLRSNLLKFILPNNHIPNEMLNIQWLLKCSEVTTIHFLVVNLPCYDDHQHVSDSPP